MHVYYTCSDFLSLLFWGYFPPRSLWLDSGAIGILITSVQCTGFSGFGVSVILFLFLCVIFSGVLKRGFQAASILVYFFFYLSNSKSNFNWSFLRSPLQYPKREMISFSTWISLYGPGTRFRSNSSLRRKMPICFLTLALGLQGSWIWLIYRSNGNNSEIKFIFILHFQADYWFAYWFSDSADLILCSSLRNLHLLSDFCCLRETLFLLYNFGAFGGTKPIKSPKSRYARDGAIAPIMVCPVLRMEYGVRSTLDLDVLLY